MDRLVPGPPAGKAESLTQVDRQGDPDDLVNATEAARMMGYANRHVIHANRRLGYFPEPDAYGPAPRGPAGPLWKRSTVWAAADRRPGKGGGGRKPGTPGTTPNRTRTRATSGSTASWPTSVPARGRPRRTSRRNGTSASGPPSGSSVWPAPCSRIKARQHEGPLAPRCYRNR